MAYLCSQIQNTSLILKGTYFFFLCARERSLDNLLACFATLLLFQAPCLSSLWDTLFLLASSHTLIAVYFSAFQAPLLVLFPSDLCLTLASASCPLSPLFSELRTPKLDPLVFHYLEVNLKLLNFPLDLPLFCSLSLVCLRSPFLSFSPSYFQGYHSCPGSTRLLGSLSSGNSTFSLVY